MKKIYKLRVPKKLAGGDPVPEFVSHGNLEASLTPGGTVETDHERFARHLEERYGLEPVSIEEIADGPEPVEEEPAAEPVVIDADEYPAGFPGREVLIENNVPHATAATLDAEQLTAYKGIGPKTAEEILAYIAGGN